MSNVIRGGLEVYNNQINSLKEVLFLVIFLSFSFFKIVSHIFIKNKTTKKKIKELKERSQLVDDIQRKAEQEMSRFVEVDDVSQYCGLCHVTVLGSLFYG